MSEPIFEVGEVVDCISKGYESESVIVLEVKYISGSDINWSVRYGKDVRVAEGQHYRVDHIPKYWFAESDLRKKPQPEVGSWEEFYEITKWKPPVKKPELEDAW